MFACVCVCVCVFVCVCVCFMCFTKYAAITSLNRTNRFVFKMQKDFFSFEVQTNFYADSRVEMLCVHCDSCDGLPTVYQNLN